MEGYNVKRVVLLLVVLIMSLTLVQDGQAADLQAGWYVKLGQIALYGIIPQPPYYTAIGWNFAVTPGTYGPFEVTTDTTHWAEWPVTIFVPTTQTGVAAGTSIYLHGLPEVPLSFTADMLGIVYETNYDSSQMIAQLYVQHNSGQTELLWTEPRSGHHWGNVNVLRQWQYIQPTDTIYFKVVAVPEPSQCLVLLTPAAWVLLMKRRASR